MVYGTIRVDYADLEDNILIKSDGMPTYNFANVIDDHLMGITHVIRGTEYLSSTPKYNLMYDAFGWERPKYIHLPTIMKDATRKLSKRYGDANFDDFVKKGYLKEAIINYVALLGWTPKDNIEKMTLPEMVKMFSLDGISKSPSIFDEMKLRWLNGEYIRKMTVEEFLEKANPYFEKAVKKDVDKTELARLLHDRCEKFSDIPEQIDFIDALPEYDISLYTHKKMKTNPENSLESLKNSLPVLEEISDWTEENIHNALFALIEKLGVKNGIILWPLRVALSGKAFTPGGAIELGYILGKDESVARIKKGIEKLS